MRTSTTTTEASMTFIQAQYSGFEAFVFKGVKFLALLDKTGKAHVYNDSLENYGSYLSIESFKKLYLSLGEKLNLDVAWTTGQEGAAQ